MAFSARDKSFTGRETLSWVGRVDLKSWVLRSDFGRILQEAGVAFKNSESSEVGGKWAEIR